MQCDACATDQGPLMKVSLGKDFFGRPYDRLSPSFDQNPKWYCGPCSMHKTLQRDFRDIKLEYEKVVAGEPSAISDSEQLQRAQLRLREIVAILSGGGTSRLLEPGDVAALLDRLQGPQPQARSSALPS